jgi:hypothetical protein
MDCPNCGLINPASATRCDCGFDFVSQTVKASYLHPSDTDDKAQKTIQRYSIVILVILVLGFIKDFLLPAPELPLAIQSVYAIVVVFLYRAIMNRSNAARVTLMVLTFPIGLVLSRSSVKLYCSRS